MRFRAASTLCLALAVLNLATAGSAAAAAAKLTGGTIAPMTGTTVTTFQFSVHFVGSTTDEAVAVSASVAGFTVPLSLSSGSVRNGTWSGTSTLPAGSWTVTYQSTSTGLTNPSFTVSGQVVVTAPTPPPPPPPTPRPTAAPATPVPAVSLSPGTSPTPLGTTVSDPSGVPSTSGSASSSQGASPSPSPSPSPGAVTGSRPFRVPLEGVVAMGLLGAVAVAAALGERRRRRAVEAFREAEASGGGAPPPNGDGPDDGWGDQIVDDETVATIEYEAPEDPWADPTTD
jgi:hypothetical protein